MSRQVELDPLCQAKEKDLDEEGVCQLCGLSFHCRVIDDEKRILDEKLVYHWLRKKKQQVQSKMHTLLAYSAPVYDKTKVKTIFISLYQSLYELIHSNTIEAIPAPMLLDNYDFEEEMTPCQIRKKVKDCNSHEEIVYWIMVQQQLPIRTTSIESETNKKQETSTNVELLLTDEDGQVQEEIAFMKTYSTSGLFNINAIAKILSDSKWKKENKEYKQKDDEPDLEDCCFLCLEAFSLEAPVFQMQYTCQHQYHQHCMESILNPHECLLCITKET